MTIVLLLRHATCDPVGRSIAGRAPGLHLNEEGRSQAESLARSLARLPIRAVYSSPLERALETARPLVRALGVPLREAPGLVELDFGDWTGRTLVELERDPRWRAFNERRETSRIPGGETMAEAVGRAAEAVTAIHQADSGGMLAAVSHGDVIRGLLAHYLGLSLDHMLRLEAAPASVSAVEVGNGWARVLSVNWRPATPV